jgi:Zn-dependent protease
MFGPIQPSRFDLVFSLFGIPVRVLPWHWLVSVLLGWDLMNDEENGPILLLMWVAIVFVSILVHEMGHALAATLFGYSPEVYLYHFGGLAVFEPYRDYTTAKAIVISLAGPAAGFALGFATLIGALIATGGRGWSFDNVLVDEAVWMSLWVNIFWSLVNLLPVLPLDGGQVCRDVCIAASPHRGMNVALWISIIVAALTGLAALRLLGSLYMAIMFFLLGLQSFQEYQARRY